MLNRALRRKNKIEAPQPPRTLAEIQKEYGDVSGKFAAAEYQAKVYADESKRLYGVMRLLNDEAQSRLQLDSAKEEQKEAKNE